MPKDQNQFKSYGFRRLAMAMKHNWSGITFALKHDPAIREVSIVVFLSVVAAAYVPVSNIERLLLAFSSLLVLLMEVVNSSIEAVVDRISMEHNPLAGHAKDLASVAVGISVLMSLLCWAVIAGPIFIKWASG